MPTLPADGFADDFGASAHDIDTADSSAVAPRPVCVIVVVAIVVVLVVVVACLRIAVANCKIAPSWPAVASNAAVADNTAIWRDLRHAVNVT